MYKSTWAYVCVRERQRRRLNHHKFVLIPSPRRQTEHERYNNSGHAEFDVRRCITHTPITHAHFTNNMRMMMVHKHEPHARTRLRLESSWSACVLGTCIVDAISHDVPRWVLVRIIIWWRFIQRNSACAFVCMSYHKTNNLLPKLWGMVKPQRVCYRTHNVQDICE